MGITSQLAEFRDLTRQMLAELRQVRELLQALVDGQRQTGNSYTFTIDRDVWAQTLEQWESDD